MSMQFKTRSDKATAKLEPPHSTDTERAVLGAVLRDAEALNSIIDILDDPGHFYVPKHREIYRAMLHLYNASEPCDLTTVADELLRVGLLEQIGGRVYLVELIEEMRSAANVGEYARRILDYFLTRRLISASTEIISSCQGDEREIDALLDDAERTIFDISEKRIRKGFVHIKSPLHDTIERLDSGQVLTGVKTGFYKLDEITLGLHAGDLIIIAGRPSMGKTSLALNIAERVATEQNIGVGVFSLEMSTEQLVFRMLSGRAGLNQQMLRKRPPNEREWPRLTTAANILSAAPIFIDDSASLSPLEMRAKARRLKAQHNVGMIIVDYIQLMRGSGRFENRQNEIAMISQSLKSMAKELSVPMIAISQLSRQVEQRGGEKRPQLADLRESGAIEQDADLVMFVYRKELYLNQDDKDYQQSLGTAEIIIAKQRNGPIGSVFLTFLKDFARFENQASDNRELPPGVPAVTGPDTPY